MATFVVLANWTEQGISAFKDTPKRADAFKEMIGKYGGSVQTLLWTIGPYDIVAIFDAPDEQTATAALLELGSLGNVRTTTLRAFGRQEIEAIIKKTG